MTTIRDVVICEPLRTPVGRFGGSFRELSAAELGTIVVRALVHRTNVPPEAINDVVLGHSYPNGEAPAIGRVVAMNAGLPTTIPGMQIDRRCGSGLEAVLYAAMQIQTGAADVIIAGGVESMSNAEFYSTSIRWGIHTETIQLVDRLVRARVTAGGDNYLIPGGMIETAENLRAKYNIPRSRQDELALTSHQRAIAAANAGIFSEEIIPISTRDHTGNERVIAEDEHPRRDTSLPVLADLPAILRHHDPDATVTAGNSSGQNDAASVCIVTHPQIADELHLLPLVRLIAWAHAGVDPALMGLGAVPATQRALKLAGLELADLDLIELNEAFAAQVLAVTTEWGFGERDFDRLNVNGSGISLGHPVGATGARILTTLARQMVRQQARYGLETMCIGGGQGLAAVFELVRH